MRNTVWVTLTLQPVRINKAGAPLLGLAKSIYWFKMSLIHERHRGYYMAARGYEFYLRVLKLKVSLTSERSERSERVRDTFRTRR